MPSNNDQTSTPKDTTTPQSPCKECGTTDGSCAITVVDPSEWKPTKKTEPFYDWVKKEDVEGLEDGSSSDMQNGPVVAGRKREAGEEGGVKEDGKGEKEGGRKWELPRHLGNSPMLGLRGGREE